MNRTKGGGVSPRLQVTLGLGQMIAKILCIIMSVIALGLTVDLSLEYGSDPQYFPSDFILLFTFGVSLVYLSLVVPSAQIRELVNNLHALVLAGLFCTGFLTYLSFSTNVFLRRYEEIRDHNIVLNGSINSEFAKVFATFSSYIVADILFGMYIGLTRVNNQINNN